MSCDYPFTLQARKTEARPPLLSLTEEKYNIKVQWDGVIRKYAHVDVFLSNNTVGCSHIQHVKHPNEEIQRDLNSITVCKVSFQDPPLTENKTY